MKIPKPGDTITERFVGLGQRGDAPQPPKVFEFHIEPASSVNSLVNGSQPQQPVQQGSQQPPVQQSQQGYAQRQYAPQQPQADPIKVNQLKAAGKSPQEIARLSGVSVEAVTAVTDQAQPQNHGGSEQQLETGEF